MANYLSVEKRKQIFRMLCEGNGIRSTGRITGCSVNTIKKFQVRISEIIDFINSKYIKDLDVEEIEADEIRTFVDHKTNIKWVYIALDRKSRMVLHFHVGKRDTNDARIFLEGLSAKLNAISKVSTDCLKSYISAVEQNPENYTPVSKTDSIELLRSKCLGRKLGRTITNRIETHNGNVRQHISRLTRRTRCFSKKTECLEQHLTLFFFYYNFIKKHQSLKTTPCESAGLINQAFTLNQLIEYDLMFTGQSPDYLNQRTIDDLQQQILAAVKVKTKRGPYKKKPKEDVSALTQREDGLSRAKVIPIDIRVEIAQMKSRKRWANK